MNIEHAIMATDRLITHTGGIILAYTTENPNVENAQDLLTLDARVKDLRHVPQNFDRKQFQRSRTFGIGYGKSELIYQQREAPYQLLLIGEKGQNIPDERVEIYIDQTKQEKDIREIMEGNDTSTLIPQAEVIVRLTEPEKESPLAVVRMSWRKGQETTSNQVRLAAHSPLQTVTGVDIPVYDLALMRYAVRELARGR